MNRKNQSRLLKEILEGDDLAAFRLATLERGLTAARRTRARRHALRRCALVLLPAMAVAVVLLGRMASSSRLSPSAAAPAPTQLAAAPTRHPNVQFINDEQLFALFPGRAMALIGKPGHQQLVFLDAR